MSEEKPPFQVPWRVRDPIYVILASNAVAAVVGLLSIMGIVYGSFLLHPFTSSAEIQHFMLYLIQSQDWGDGMFLIQEFIILLFLSVFITRRYGVKSSQFWVPGQMPQDIRLAVRMVFVGLMIALGIVVGIIAIVQLVIRVAGGDPQAAVQSYLSGLERESKIILSPEISWLRVMIVTLIAPPLEELLYRGCLYAALRKRMGPWGANAVSSGIFALSHSHLLFGLPNILVIGVLGGYIYERSRSLVPCIVFHALWNLFCCAPVKPALWPVLFVLMGGLYLWSTRGRLAGGYRNSRIAWKLFAVAFTLATLLSSFRDSNAWVVLIQLPACVALLSYAWRKEMGSVLAWRVYLYLFLAWSLYEWWKLSLSQGLQRVPGLQDLAAMAFFLGLTIPTLLVLIELSHAPSEEQGE